MTRSARTPLVALLLLLGLVAAACGQKAGVAQVSAAGGSGGAFDSAAPGFDDLGEKGTVDGGGTMADGGPGTPAGGGATTSGGTSGSGGATGGGTPAAGPGAPASGGTDPAGGSTTATTAVPAGDRTGITDTEIVIGVHAPVTGAAPVPQDSFREARDLYWRFIQERDGGVFSRTVKVVFEDDQFDPRTAVAVCKKMVTEDKAFLLVGGGGSDQITACAQYANSVGVPYLSAGVNEVPLNQVRAYFALSQTYAQQATPILQYVAKRFGKLKLGIAVGENGSNDDAYAAALAAAEAQGFDVVYSQRLPKSVNTNAALGIAADMSSSGAEVMYLITSPTSFINIAAAGNGQGYRPQYIGPGIQSGLNTVAQIGCQAAGDGLDGSIYWSPFPQLDVVDSFDPDFRTSYAKFLGGQADDLSLALWGLNKVIHQIFLEAGPNMTRQSIVQVLEAGKTYETNLFPSVSFSAQDHFGASTAHVLEADCSTSTYKTVETFVSGF